MSQRLLSSNKSDVPFYMTTDNLHKLGVQVITHVGLFGIAAEDAYFEYTISGESVALEKVDSHCQNKPPCL